MSDILRKGIFAAIVAAASVAACGSTPSSTSDPPVGSATSALHGDHDGDADDGEGGLPVAQIEQAVGASGHVSGGILVIPIARKDIGDVAGPLGVTFTPSFIVHGTLFFQPLPGGRALLNGNMALLGDEVNPFIDALIDNGLILQAYHQHLIGMTPQIWFNHFRAVGDPVAIATAIHNAIAVTATPLPQLAKGTPTTPLDADRLAKILHGKAHVAADGTVTVLVTRWRGRVLGRVWARPGAGFPNVIQFKPTGGDDAAVVPDFGMSSWEVMPVVRHMRKDLGWFQGCLYNQETAEHPQLYFDHMLKTGNAYDLAREIRSGLDLMPDVR